MFPESLKNIVGRHVFGWELGDRLDLQPDNEDDETDNEMGLVDH